MTEGKEEVPGHLRHTEGQIHGVQKIVDEEKGCIDVITQLNVVRSSIGHVMRMAAIENLRHCFENPEKDPKERRE